MVKLDFRFGSRDRNGLTLTQSELASGIRELQRLATSLFHTHSFASLQEDELPAFEISTFQEPYDDRENGFHALLEKIKTFVTAIQHQFDIDVVKVIRTRVDVETHDGG